MGNASSTATRRTINSITHDGKHVRSRNIPTIATYHQDEKATMLTYDSGAYIHYLSEKDRKKLGPPILRILANKIGVDNGGAYNGKYVTKLTLPQKQTHLKNSQHLI